LGKPNNIKKNRQSKRNSWTDILNEVPSQRNRF